jgi:4-diphosphocytidyl-2-C-methyl-D-erythritol kinase
VTVRLDAPAKINLSLRVLGRRADGFHEIRTVFQAIELADEVQLSREGRGVELETVGADLGPPAGNLAYRAAEAFLKAFPDSRGVRIRLVKRIPAGAGLGGGSSDAAAVLRCLAEGLPAPPSPAELAHLGASLGSDVPFFLGSSTLAAGVGRGERLRPLAPLPEADLVLALPPAHVSTADAYRALRRAPLDGGWEREESEEGDGPEDWDSVIRGLHNDFEAVVAAEQDTVAQSLRALRSAGASGVLMSGSGAASFGLFENRRSAEHAARELSGALGWPFVATRTLRAWPRPLSRSRPNAARAP